MSYPQDPWPGGESAESDSSLTQPGADSPAMSAYERDRMRFVTSRGRRADERAHEQQADSLVTPWCSVEGRQVIEDYARYKEYRTRFYARYDPVEDPWAPDGEVIIIPVPLPSDLAPGDGIIRRSTKKIGLNAMKTFNYVPSATTPITKYGDTESQFNDCAALGVKVIRQFGLADLLWGMLSSGTTGEVPLESGLETIILSNGNTARIAELFAEAHRTHTKVIFTFLTLGGGADPIRSPSVQDPRGKMESVLPLSWSEDHLSEQVNGYPFNYFTRGRSIAVKNWLLKTLDIRSGYKRYYFGLIAKHASALLRTALTKAQILTDNYTLSLKDVVEGVEIFNEIDTRSRIFKSSRDADIAEQAYWWALAYVECAEAFYRGLSGEIPILLPGLSSYLPESGFKWPEKLQFLDNFLYQVDTEASTRGLSTYSIASGIDYHWYHRKSGQERHIGYLIHEVDEIQSLLDKYISTECAITIMETGVAVKDDFSPRVRRGRFSGARNNFGRLAGNLFQSNEVWRRLGGVLASGATGAGWHSWMSGFPENFELMGLRVDHTPPRAPASEAHARWSWFSFARLATMLGEVFAGQMILPVITSRSDLSAMNKADGLVVFELMLVDSSSFGRHRYAYLVFYDPTSEANGATVEVSSASSVVHASLVSTRVNGPPTSSGGGLSTLPTDRATFDPDALLTIPAVLTVYKEDSPLLIFTDQRLRWANVAAFGTAKP